MIINRLSYPELYKEFGATPPGVGWGSAASQMRRFFAIAEEIGDKDFYSILDVGCGYGALKQFIETQDIDYFGIDRERCYEDHWRLLDPEDTKFRCCTLPDLGSTEKYTYVVGSGIFCEPETDIIGTLQSMIMHASQKVIVNFLYMRDRRAAKIGGRMYYTASEIARIAEDMGMPFTIRYGYAPNDIQLSLNICE